MIVSIIVAVASNGVIGCENRLIWHIREDLQRFKRLTTGHPIVMGRKTFESLGRPLPGRLNVVITRNPHFTAPGVVVVHSLELAMSRIETSNNPQQALPMPDAEQLEVFIIGGGEIYSQAMPLADKLYVTHIDATPQGDTLFPKIDPHQWQRISTQEYPASQQNPIGYKFSDYKRIKASKC